MADDLKRVGLVFKADGAVDFKKSLQEVNNSIQENRSEFKLAQSQWDENTKSIDKLKDRQKYLAAQTKDYSDKVKMLQGELKELENCEKSNAENISKKREQLEATKNTSENYRKKCADLRVELEKIEAEEEQNEEAIKKKRAELEKAEKGFADYSFKAEKLENELEKLNKKEANNTTAISKKKTQLNQAKMSLNTYQKGLEEVTKELKNGSAQIEDYVKKIEDIGNKSENLGKTLSKTVTAPITAVGTAAVAAAMELDDGYDTIITKTGATGEALEELNDVADEVFSNMAVEMSDVGIAIGEVNTRFGSTGEELKGLSELFIRFAEINGTDLNSSIDTVDKIMTQYKIDASQTGNVLGILTKRSQETGIATDELMNLVSDNSATFKEVGLSLTDSINLLSQFETNGVDASTAIAGLRKSITNMAADGVSADEALGKIITSIKNAKTETDAINIASETFGTKGAVEMTNAIREGRFSIDDLSDALENYSDTVTSTYEETLDPWDQMTVATNKLKVAGSDLASEGFEVLAPMIDGLTAGIEELTEWFSGLDEDEKQNIVTIGLIIATIGPLLILFGKMCTGIGSIITTVGKIPSVLSAVGTGAKALWGIVSANPFGAFIILIMSVLAVFTALYEKCDWFREKVDKTWSGIKTFLKGIKEWLLGIFKFEWKLPKIKLPHFSISGNFSLSPPSIPKIGVEWYSKGGILTRPTAFDINGNDVKVGGEKEPEAVLPISLLKKYIRDENQLNNAFLAEMIKEAIADLRIVAENNIYIGDKKIYSILTDMVIKRLSENARDIRFAKGTV